MFKSLFKLRLLKKPLLFKNSRYYVDLAGMKKGEVPPPEKKDDLIFGRYLLLTNTMCCGLLSSVEQFLIKNSETVEGKNKSTAETFLTGSLQGPWQHFFFKWLHKIMPVVSLQNSFLKIILDIIIGTPAGVFLLFITDCFRKKKEPKEIADQFRTKFVTVEYIDYALSPVKQFINFHFLNPKFNVVFINTMNTFQNILFSYLKK